MPRYIDPKSVDSSPQPKAQRLMHRCAHLGVPPIEIGLLAQIGVVVVLAGRFIQCPGPAAEVAEPVIWRPAIRSRIPPDIPVAFRIIARPPARHEPRMCD